MFGNFSWKKYFRERRLKRKTPQEIFSLYFMKNKWGCVESRSGKGSNLSSTKNVRDLLPNLFRRLNIKNILDLPCGDFNWMQHVELEGVSYTGGDIVDDLIIYNQKKYSSNGFCFKKIDLISDRIEVFDLIFSRDCLVHLSNSHIFMALENIKKSGSKYLLTTHYPDSGHNMDILTGDWRAVNLCRAPFEFPAPQDIFAETYVGEKGQQSDKSLALWLISDIPSYENKIAQN